MSATAPRVPASEEIEAALLGAALTRPAGLEAALGLPPEHCYRPAHAELLEAIQALGNAGKPVDARTVANYLNSRGLLAVCGGRDAIERMAEAGREVTQPEHYAEILRDKAARRSLLQLAAQIHGMALEEERPLDDVLDETRTRVDSALDQGPQKRRAPFGVELRETLDEIIDGARNGRDPVEIGTGLARFDTLTGGLHRGELTILAARTSGGKTALALNIGRYVAQHTGAVLMFSLEMPAKQLHKRLLSTESGVDHGSIRGYRLDEGQIGQMEAAYRRMEGLPLILEDTADVSLRTVKAKARETGGSLALIILDYLQIMTLAGIRGDKRYEVLDEASRLLKLMALQFNVAVIALSQLSRAPGQRDDKRPLVTDLRESGGIEQSADNVWFVHSDAYDKVSRGAPQSEQDAELIIAKQRNGVRGISTMVRWYPGTLRFVEVDERHDAPPERREPYAEPDDEDPYAEPGETLEDLQARASQAQSALEQSGFFDGVEDGQ